MMMKRMKSYNAADALNKLPGTKYKVSYAVFAYLQ